MKHHENKVGWLVFAILCIGIGWFAHQYFPTFATTMHNGTANKMSTQPNEPKEKDAGEFCEKVITPAINPETGDIQEFPTTCSVPKGWELIENDIPDLDLQVQ